MHQAYAQIGRGGWSCAALAGRGTWSPVSTDQAPPVNVPGIDKPVIVVTGEINGTETWTNNFYYVLRGAVFVGEGATLNIQAGTRVIGEAGSVGTLIVVRGGRLNAIGTREAADRVHERPADRQPRPRRLGRPHHQRPRAGQPRGRRRRGEGDTGVYGGNDPNDNSGIAALRARRVRRHRVQPRQRAERHRVPGRRPRRHATSTSRCT